MTPDGALLPLAARRRPENALLIRDEPEMAMNDVNVVLAHGGWADGSSWARVITGLAAHGVRASAAPLPLTSLADDVVALNRSIERMPGPLVLVAHAYAGAVIGLARPERVKALVYVTAFAPDDGEKLTDLFFRAEPHPQAPKLAPDSANLLWLPDEAFPKAFAQNASAEELTMLAAVQRPLSFSCMTVPAGPPLWKNVPTWYLVAEHDRMILPATQRFMADRMRAKIKSHAVDHTPIITAPGPVVDIIREAVQSVGGT
jgi:pimeloyl-ACP methyl ester carboxylesterase